MMTGIDREARTRMLVLEELEDCLPLHSESKAGARSGVINRSWAGWKNLFI